MKIYFRGLNIIINILIIYVLGINMAERVLISLPKKDVEALMKIMEDIRFIEKVEKGREEIKEGKYINYEDFKKKHKLD